MKPPFKPLVFALCLAPAVWLGWLALSGGLGVNPVETVNRFLGDWALRLLVIALAVTPLRQLTGLHPLARLRRMLGLYAFFYLCLHILSYVVLDHYFDWVSIWGDIVKRRYITVGMVVFLILLPLAVTSTNAMIRRLGGRRWQRLHRLVYVAGPLAVLHYWWMVKADKTQPIIYGALVALLLAWRLARAVRFPVWSGKKVGS